MKSGNTYFCDVCSAEIVVGELTNEFSIDLLARKAHAHAECLTQRNAIVAQYNEITKALTDLIDPEVPSAQKQQQAAFVESKRDRPLKRVPPRGPRA